MHMHDIDACTKGMWDCDTNFDFCLHKFEKNRWPHRAPTLKKWTRIGRFNSMRSKPDHDMSPNTLMAAAAGATFLRDRRHDPEWAVIAWLQLGNLWHSMPVSGGCSDSARTVTEMLQLMKTAGCHPYLIAVVHPLSPDLPLGQLTSKSLNEWKIAAKGLHHIPPRLCICYCTSYCVTSHHITSHHIISLRITSHNIISQVPCTGIWNCSLIHDSNCCFAVAESQPAASAACSRECLGLLWLTGHAEARTWSKEQRHCYG